ncbi:hypothetical protein [Acidithiobacillus ferriphilus]|uniref:hypothetical protein n=1 Tax=Acidithiobacillus ferriphilus TaxID=1689834 RepID=UPI002DBC3FCD|nr:hypothetical protein [Acidithiobacillus ferriphilus]
MGTVTPAFQDLLSGGAALYDRQTEGPQRQGRTAGTSSLVLEGGHRTAYDLRRTCASGMQKLGVMPAVIPDAGDVIPRSGGCRKFDGAGRVWVSVVAPGDLLPAT